MILTVFLEDAGKVDNQGGGGKFPKSIALGPQVATRLLKRSIYNAADMTFEQSLDEIASKTAISDHHEDAKEGVKAFHKKREASFNKWLIKKDRTSVS